MSSDYLFSAINAPARLTANDEKRLMERFRAVCGCDHLTWSWPRQRSAQDEPERIVEIAREVAA